MSRTFRNDRRVKVRNPYVVPSHQRKADVHETARDKERRRRKVSRMEDENGEPITPFYEPDQADTAGLNFIDERWDEYYPEWETCGGVLAKAAANAILAQNRAPKANTGESE